MKMKQAHYADLEAMMGGLLRATLHSREALLDLAVKNDAADPEAFVCWAVFTASTRGSVLRGSGKGSLYEYLNDSHIETAIRRIFNSYYDLEN